MEIEELKSELKSIKFEMSSLQKKMSLREKEIVPTTTAHYIPGLYTGDRGDKNGRPVTLEILQHVTSVCASGGQFSKVRLLFLSFFFSPSPSFPQPLSFSFLSII